MTGTLSLDRDPPQHLLGDRVWSQTEGMEREVLLAAVSGASNHYARLEQSPFRSFGRVMRLDLPSSTSVAVVVSAEQLLYPRNDVLFSRYRDQLSAYLLEHSDEPPRIPFLTQTLPAWVKPGFAELIGYMSRLGAQQIEQRGVNSGFVLTNSYPLLKSVMRGSRFADVDGPRFRDVDAVRQPYLGIVDGETSFAVVDYSQPDPLICGLVFLGPPPNGVFGSEREFKVSPNGVVLQVKSTRVIRLVAHSGPVFEIVARAQLGRSWRAAWVPTLR